MSKIEVKKLYKIFGPEPGKLEKLKAGMSKEDLLQKNGVIPWGFTMFLSRWSRGNFCGNGPFRKR